MREWPRIIVFDFEYVATSGERPEPVCLVWRELHSGNGGRLWRDQMVGHPPPFPINDGTLFCAFYSTGDLSCFRALGWSLPTRIIDAYVEFRNALNGRQPPSGWGLLGAMEWFGLPAIDVVEKKDMIRLINSGGPWSENERGAILDYCATDVDALARLLPVLWPTIDVPRALLRGRYMRAVSTIEDTGIPIDVPLLDRVMENWSAIQDDMVRRLDCGYGVYERDKTGWHFRAHLFRNYLARTNTPWPLLESGALDLSQKTFRQQARTHPHVSTLRELRHSLSELRLNRIRDNVGRDGRSRVMLSPFRSRSGRNQPSNSKYPFGTSVWTRGFIRPEPGRALAYIDYSQQEFAIAAALSGDIAMQEAYLRGDPYWSFAQMAGAVPPDSRSADHKAVREVYKICALGTLYGQEACSLAHKIGRSTMFARKLLADHKRTFGRFWQWSDRMVDTAMLTGKMTTCFGWRLHVGENANPRSLRNHPMQAHGAEMLRLAACFVVEAGIEVLALVHDAILISASSDEIDHAIDVTREMMRKASLIVLDGFEVRTDDKKDIKIIHWPDRYMDEKRGAEMWATVMNLIGGEEQAVERKALLV